MKYKKGDKVEVVEFISSVAAEYGAKIGDIGIVDIASDVGDGAPYFVKLAAIEDGDNGLWFSEEGIKLAEKAKIETGDIVSIISNKNTAATYGWNKDMKQVGESMKVDGVYGVTVENDIFVYHIDDLVLLRKSDSDVVEPHVENQDDLVEFVVTEPTVMISSAVESDGGSSSYYFTKLPNWLLDKIAETGGIEIKDIVQFVYDNDAHAKDILKAQKRIIEQRKGRGKAGLKPLYDYNKIVFFAEDQLNVATHALSELDR